MTALLQASRTHADFGLPLTRNPITETTLLAVLLLAQRAS
jgi:hypothetical protein